MADKNKRGGLSENRESRKQLPYRSTNPSATWTPSRSNSSKTVPLANTGKADPKWNPKGNVPSPWNPKEGPNKITGGIMPVKKESASTSKAAPTASISHPATTKGEKTQPESSKPASQVSGHSFGRPATPSTLSSWRSERLDRETSLYPDRPASFLSFHSDHTRDPAGEARQWYKKGDSKSYRELIESIEPGYYIKHGALMLIAGQGGTFGYGDFYVTERGDLESRENAKTSSAKTKHLQYWGGDIEAIGTRGCVSCLGVYFELKGNRVFCAHINCWHDSRTYDVPNLVHGESRWKDIKDKVLTRLREHAAEYDWTREDVIIDSLVLVCPQPLRLAGAVIEAVSRDFLGLGRPYFRESCHGLIYWPGYRTKDKRQFGKLLNVLALDEWKDRTTAPYEDVPGEIHQVLYTDEKNQVAKQEWCYTYNRGWHEIPLYHDRFENANHRDASTPGNSNQI